MKKISWIVLVLLVALLLVACQSTPEQPADSPTDTPTAEAPSDQPTDEPEDEDPTDSEPPQEEPYDIIDLIVNSTSDYTVVYDDSDPMITEQAKAFVKFLDHKYFVDIEAVGISEAEKDYGHEIVIGEIRSSGREAAKALKGGDFSISVVEDDLVMCATNGRLYSYLFDVFTYQFLSSYSKGSLTISSEQNFLYSASALSATPYVEYLKQRNTMTRELVEELFEYATFTASDGTILPYRLYVPYEYDPDKEYPVLVVLHGAGERGTDNKGNIYHMLHDMFSHADTPLSEAIIIAPQCPAAPNQWVDTPWANGNYSVDRVAMSNELGAVLELLWEIEDEFSTDIDRYYITGLSMGGFGTWDMIMRYPEVFAAAVPICGGADPSYAAEICDMPIYTIHGSADPTVPVAGTRAMVEALKAQGSPVIYQELEGEGHGVWNWAAQNADVWEWLFSQK